MKKLILKLLVALALHILYFVVIAGIGITNTVLGRKAVWLELSFFLLLEILLFVVCLPHGFGCTLLRDLFGIFKSILKFGFICIKVIDMIDEYACGNLKALKLI